MCATFPGRAPSQVARPLIEPYVTARITDLDWYAFDVAATARWQELQQQANGETPGVDTRGASEIPEPSTETRNGPLHEGPGGAFRLIGDEVPPWER